jgi:hypothetical protein
MPKLSRAEVKRLVEAIIEDRGTGLSYDDFSETVGLYLENVPGCESLRRKEFERIVKECWKCYERSG